VVLKAVTQEEIWERLDKAFGGRIGWVTGSFVNDAIVARVEDTISFHAFEEKARRWRWNIAQQEWCPACPRSLNADETLRVIDWLEQHGWIATDLADWLIQCELEKVQ
jgi:hypothetical protein